MRNRSAEDRVDDHASSGKKRAAFAAVSCACLLTVCAGGALAYLTGNDSKPNTFTIGEVKIDTTEPNYTGNGKTGTVDLTADTEITKDPQITNTGTNPAVCFIVVDIPMKEMITVQEDGTRNPFANTEIFNYRRDGAPYNSTGNGWVLLEETYLDKDMNVMDPDSLTFGVARLSPVKSAKNGETTLETLTKAEREALEKEAAENPEKPDKEKAGWCRRLWGYDHALAAGETTSAIFDQIQVANVIEGFLDNTTQNLVVTSYAIQADNIFYVTGSYDLKNMQKERLSQIWNAYVKQSGQVAPPDADTSGTVTANGGTLNLTIETDSTHLHLGTGYPEDAETHISVKLAYTGDKDVPGFTFTSSDERIAKVDANGHVTGMNPGTAVITVKAINPDTNRTVSASVTIKVLDVNAPVVVE